LCDEVGFGEAATGLDDAYGCLAGPGKISAAEVLIELVGKKLPTFDDVFGLGLEQPLRSGDPTATNGNLSSDVQQYAEPRGEADGSQRVFISDPVLVSGLQGPYGLVDIPQQIGRRGERHRVFRAEVAAPTQPVEGESPVATIECVASLQ
jgi:hypothetical protein